MLKHFARPSLANFSGGSESFSNVCGASSISRFPFLFYFNAIKSSIKTAC
jgi:hypothetical protein